MLVQAACEDRPVSEAAHAEVRLPAESPARKGLPPGPSTPRALTTARLVARSVALMESCRRRYGEPFTLRVIGGGDMVFLSDPPSLKRLFGADRTNRMSPGRTGVLRPVVGERSVLLLEGAEHLRRRRLMLPQFHGARMRAYGRLMRDVATREVERWRLGKPFPLHPAMQQITLEVIMEAVFGVTEHARREQLREAMVRLLSETRSPRAAAFTLPAVRRLGAYSRIDTLLERTDAILADEIAARRADPALPERDDILSLLIGARFDDGSAMDDVELRDQLMTLLLAGHETTATALSWAFDLLFRHPEVLRRLEAGGDGEDQGYLDAVIAETLRIRPVVPFVGRQLAEPLELGGYELPADTVAVAAIYLTHTRPDVYSHPYEFRPERFLDGNPETFSWIPFGGGTRRCLGAAFAEFEMRTVLPAILARAELQPASDRPEPIVRRNVTLAPKHGTPAVLVARR
jgi:cytochrome P450